MRTEKFGDFRKQRQLIALPFHKVGERSKTFLALRVSRHEPDSRVARCIRFNSAGGISRDGGIHGHGARMK